MARVQAINLHRKLITGYYINFGQLKEELDKQRTKYPNYKIFSKKL